MSVAALENDSVTSEEVMGWTRERSDDEISEFLNGRRASLNAKLAELALTGESQDMEDLSDIEQIELALAA